MLSNKAHINTFLKGLNKDLDKSLFPNDSYFHAENVRIVSDSNNTFGALENIKGNTLQHSFSAGSFVLGMCVVRNTIIYFVKSTVGSELYKSSVNTDGTLTTPSLIYTDSNKSTKLNFNANNLIKSVGYYETEFSQKVYFTDGVNPIRFFNIADSNLANLLPTQFEFNIQGNLYEADLDTVLQGSGELKAGVIQYTYRLYRVYGQTSVFAPLSKLYHITKYAEGSPDYRGSIKDTICNKTYRVKISRDKWNTGSSPFALYDKIQVYSVHYSELNGVAEVRMIADEDLPSIGDFYTNDYGQDLGGEGITIDEILEVKDNNFVCRDLEIKNNHLFAANIKENYFDLTGIDTRAYRWEAFVEDGNSTFTQFPDIQTYIYKDLTNRLKLVKRYNNTTGIHEIFSVRSQNRTSSGSTNWIDTNEVNPSNPKSLYNWGIPDDYNCINYYNFDFDEYGYILNDGASHGNTSISNRKDALFTGNKDDVAAPCAYTSNSFQSNIAVHDGIMSKNTSQLLYPTVQYVKQKNVASIDIIGYARRHQAAPISMDPGNVASNITIPSGISCFIVNGVFNPIYESSITNAYTSEVGLFTFSDQPFGKPRFTKSSPVDIHYMKFGGSGSLIGYNFVTSGESSTLRPHQFDLRSFKRGEVYRFYFQGRNKYGQYSFPQWIGDIKIPEVMDVDGEDKGASSGNVNTSLCHANFSFSTAYSQYGTSGNFIFLNFFIHNTSLLNSKGVVDYRILYDEPIKTYRNRVDQGIIGTCDYSNTKYVKTDNVSELSMPASVPYFNILGNYSTERFVRSSSTFNDFATEVVNTATEGLTMYSSGREIIFNSPVSYNISQFVKYSSLDLIYNNYNFNRFSVKLQASYRSSFNSDVIKSIIPINYKEYSPVTVPADLKNLKIGFGYARYANIRRSFSVSGTSCLPWFYHKGVSLYINPTPHNYNTPNGAYPMVFDISDGISLLSEQSTTPINVTSSSCKFAEPYTTNNNPLITTYATSVGDNYYLYSRLIKNINLTTWNDYISEVGTNGYYLDNLSNDVETKTINVQYQNNPGTVFPFNINYKTFYSSCTKYFSTGCKGIIFNDFVSSKIYSDNPYYAVFRNYIRPQSSNTTFSLDNCYYINPIVDIVINNDNSKYGGIGYNNRGSESLIPCSYFTVLSNKNMCYGDTYVGVAPFKWSEPQYIYNPADYAREGSVFSETGSIPNASRAYGILGVYGALSYLISPVLETIINPILTHGEMRKSINNKSNISVVTSNAGSKFIASFDRDASAKSNYYNQELDLYLYNSVYSKLNNTVKFSTKPLDWQPSNKRDCLIKHSDFKENGEVIDSFTVFKTGNQLEVDTKYGYLSNIVNYNNYLYFFQEKAFGLLAVYDRQLSPDATPNKSLVLGIGGVLDRYDYISTTTGNSELFGIAQGKSGLYWYDRHNKEIVRFGQSAEAISKTKSIQSLCNNISNDITNVLAGVDRKFNEVLTTIKYKTNSTNITVGSSVYTTASYIIFELSNPDYLNTLTSPIFTYSNVNYYQGAIPDFPGKDSNKYYINVSIPPAFGTGAILQVRDNKQLTIVFNESADYFTGLYTFYPVIYLSNSNYYYTVSPLNTSVYLHNTGNYATFYGTKYDSKLSLLVNPEFNFTKAFDTAMFFSSSWNGDINIEKDTFNYVRFYNDFQNTDYIQIDTNNKQSITRRERGWALQIPRNRVDIPVNTNPNIFNPSNISTNTKLFGERIRDKYVVADLIYNNNNNYRFNCPYIITNYRVSYR